LGCAALLKQSHQSNDEISLISTFTQPLKAPMVQPGARQAALTQPMWTRKTDHFMQPLKAEAKAPAKPAKAAFSKQAWEDEFKGLLESPEKYMPEFGGSTGGLLRKAQEEEKYAITWTGKKDELFEMPTGGSAAMKDGTNLVFLARKEHCLALGTQLRTKFKIKEFRVFRIFPNGEMQFLHPADGVFPEKVNKGRQMASTVDGSIGQNVPPAKMKWSGEGVRGGGMGGVDDDSMLPYKSKEGWKN